MAFIRACIGFVLAVVLTAFAVSNRQVVAVDVGPLWPAQEVPLYLLVLGFAAFGFVFGGFFVWLNGASVRRAKRVQKKEIKNLEREVEDLKVGEHKGGVPMSEFFPALPAKKG